MDSSFWTFLVGLLIAIAIVGPALWVMLFAYKDVRSRIAAGRSSVGAIWDVLMARAGGIFIGVFTIILIVAIGLPLLMKELAKNRGKTESGDAIIMIFENPQGIPDLINEYGKAALGQTNIDPWEASSVTTAPSSSLVMPTSSPQTELIYSAFSTGQGFDACGYRFINGTYQFIVCSPEDQPTGESRPITGSIPSGAPQPPSLPTQSPTPVIVPTSAPPSPLLFESSEVASQCFWSELLARKSELKTFGASLLPAGSSWILESKNSGFWNSLENEQWNLCTVKWGKCLPINGLEADKLNGRSLDVFYGTGASFPAQCVPATNP